MELLNSILAIDTTGPYCSTALLKVTDGGEFFYESNSREKLSHLQNLMPMVKEVLEEAEVSLGEVSKIAVSIGPGSFTGIRIGVTTARTLCQVLDKELIPVDTLKAFTFNEGEIVCPLFNARREQIYGGAYMGNEDIVSGNPYMINEYLDLLKNEIVSRKLFGEVVFYGDGIDAYKNEIENFIKDNLKLGVSFRISKEEDRYQKAIFVAKSAKGVKGKRYNEVLPNYMRKAEAERKLEEKNG